jgi:hypothetical protein
MTQLVLPDDGVVADLERIVIDLVKICLHLFCVLVSVRAREQVIDVEFAVYRGVQYFGESATSASHRKHRSGSQPETHFPNLISSPISTS